MKRCQYRLPGMHYNCRAVGKYELSGRVYCAWHHRIQEERENPEYGQQHDWTTSASLTKLFFGGIDHCARCGVVRHREGIPQSPCGGKLPRIVCREAS
jgi:hypothetical protein